jgi:hypothetical protein
MLVFDIFEFLVDSLHFPDYGPDAKSQGLATSTKMKEDDTI